MVYVTPGTPVKCTIGNAVAIHKSFGFDFASKTGTCTVDLLGREVIWPTHAIKKATVQELDTYEFYNKRSRRRSNP